jgi:hypothetical protein
MEGHHSSRVETAMLRALKDAGILQEFVGWLLTCDRTLRMWGLRLARHLD